LLILVVGNASRIVDLVNP